jgi:hypothetical protein
MYGMISNGARLQASDPQMPYQFARCLAAGPARGEDAPEVKQTSTRNRVVRPASNCGPAFLSAPSSQKKVLRKMKIDSLPVKAGSDPPASS